MTDTILQVVLQSHCLELILPNKYREDIKWTGCEVISWLKTKVNHLLAV